MYLIVVEVQSREADEMSAKVVWQGTDHVGGEVEGLQCTKGSDGGGQSGDAIGGSGQSDEGATELSKVLG